MEKIKLFRVTVHELSENQHFPIDYNHQDKYFEWSKSLDKKLLEFNTVKINSDDDFLEVEKDLLFCEIDKKLYENFNDLDFENGCIDYTINFDWQILKTQIIKK